MKNKIFVVLFLIILIGLLIGIILGFNVDFDYRNHNLVSINIGQEFNIDDIKSITNDVFPNQKLQIQRAGAYSDNLVIKVNEINDEQKNTLNTKINEKFGIDNKVEDIEVNYISNYRLRDIVTPYIIPIIISTVLILIYMGIRFRQIGIAKVISQIIGLSIIAEMLYLAILAITRYPINRLVMPVGIVIYMIILAVLTSSFEKQLSIEKE